MENNQNLNKILKFSAELKNKKLIVADEKFIEQGMIINGIPKIELGGGKKSLINGYVNVDIKAEEGIKTRIENLDKVIKNNTVNKIIVNNPYGIYGTTILKIANSLLKLYSEIMISGTWKNKYFNELLKNAHKEKISKLGFSFYFEKGKLDESLKGKKFYQTSGAEIPIEKMMTFYAKKEKILSKKEVKNGKIPR
jgi:RNase H-fold protein (predicted Holliday junction resolvase)